MEISFKKDLKVSNLVISGLEFQSSDDFTIKMLSANRIPALLNTNCSVINGETCYLYDISSLHSFSKLYETEKPDSRALHFFLLSLKRLISSLDEYLLNADNIILIPECIFLNSARDEFYFCCCPAYKENILEQLKALSINLLSLIDYNDAVAVSLAFEFSRAVQAENFTVSDLSFILKNSSENIFPAFSQTNETPGLSEVSISHMPDTFSGEEDPQNSESRPDAQKIKASTEIKKISSPLTFGQKARIYFNGKSFSEIYDDINSAKIFKKIRACEQPAILKKEDIIPQENSLFESSDYVSLNTGIYHPKEFSGNAAALKEIPSGSQIFTNKEKSILHTARLNTHVQNTAVLTGTGAMKGIYISLDHFPFTIGNHANADFSPDSPTVSRIHARFCKDKKTDSICLEDMNSTNGTFLNNTQLEAYTPVELAPGDLLNFAGCEFFFN